MELKIIEWGNNKTFVIMIVMVFIFLILTCGEPDLLDAMIYWLTDGGLKGE